MSWTAPKYSKRQVDQAAKTLILGVSSPEEEERALETLNNWRSAHAFPLNTFQIGLREYALKIDSRSITAQRLKRRSSVLYKLRRFKKMELSRMQDIGGCRAVVIGIKNLNKLHETYRKSNIKHKLVNEKNYVSDPKPSGYRGIHLVYRYYSDKNHTYDGLQIEIQLRTRVQHAWATAVEIIGLFVQHSLKSSEGPEKWLRFFSLMGSVFAHVEKTPRVPGTPELRSELKETVRKLSRELKVIQKLDSYGKSLKIIDGTKIKGAHFYLLYLKPKTGKLKITAYKKDQSEIANKAYLEIEKRLIDDKGAEAVLVSVDSIGALKTAYPNYYLDTTRFVEYLRTYLRRGKSFN